RVDLGDKRQYDPQAAQAAARNHADHFAGVLKETAARRAKDKEKDAGVTAPVDAGRFGDWWVGGGDFLPNVDGRPGPQWRAPRDGARARRDARPPGTHHSAHRGIVGERRRLFILVERADLVDLETSLGARSGLLVRGTESAAGRPETASRARAGDAVPAARAGLGLAIHHLRR